MVLRREEETPEENCSQTYLAPNITAPIPRTPHPHPRSATALSSTSPYDCSIVYSIWAVVFFFFFWRVGRGKGRERGEPEQQDIRCQHPAPNRFKFQRWQSRSHCTCTQLVASNQLVHGRKIKRGGRGESLAS